jgi:hypothetical protein
VEVVVDLYLLGVTQVYAIVEACFQSCLRSQGRILS